MNKKQNLLLICILLILLVGTGVQAVSASHSAINSVPTRVLPAQQANECIGMDIVILIDQSHSMEGGAGSIPNDKDGRRISSTKLMMDWLARNHIDLCPEVTHRFAVVSFGETTVRDIDPPEIIAPSGFEEWKVIQDDLEEQIVARDLGFTDHKLAFDEAQAIFAAMDDSSIDTPRKKAIIVLTDGVPNLGDFDRLEYLQNMEASLARTFPFDDSLLERENALSELEDRYNGYENIPVEKLNEIPLLYPVDPEAYRDSYYIWFIAMDDENDYLEYALDSFKNISRTHGGRLIQLSNNQNDVPLTFTRVLNRLGGLNYIVINCGEIGVNPYLSGATMDIFTSTTDIDVFIYYLDKDKEPIAELIGGAGDQDFFHLIAYNDYQAIEHYQFEFPPAGTWEIYSTACEAVDVTFSTIESDINLIYPTYTTQIPVAPVSEHPLGRGFQLKLQITDSNINEVIEQNPDPEFEMDVVAEIFGPAGSTQLALEYDNAAKSWISTSSLPARSVGTYEFSITGTANCAKPIVYEEQCPDGDRFEVFNYPQGFYAVVPLGDGTYTITVGEPQQGGSVPLRKWNGVKVPDENPIAIQIELIDENGQAVPIDQALTTTNVRFDESSIAYAGIAYPLVFQISPDGYSILGTVEEELIEKGEYTLSLLPGEHYRSITRWEDSVPENALEQQVISFSRNDRLLVLYWSILGTGIAVFLVVLFMMIDNLRNAVHGQLEFINNETGRKVVLSLNRRRKVVNIRKHNTFPKLGVKRIAIRNGGVRINKQVIEVKIDQTAGRTFERPLVDGGNPTPVNEKVKVAYRWGKEIVGKDSRNRRGSSRPSRGSARPSTRGQSRRSTSNRKSRKPRSRRR